MQPKIYSRMIFSGIFLVIAGLIYILNPILTPFLVGAFLAYLGNPLVVRLQKHCSRSVAATLVFILIILIVIAFFVLLIPILQKETVILFDKIPSIVNFTQTNVLPWLNEKAQRYNINPNLDMQTLQGLVGDHWQQAGQLLNRFWQTLSHSGSTVITWVMNVLLIPVVTFYLLRDWPKLLTGLESLLPRKNTVNIINVFNECDSVLNAFFRGQLLVMIALGIIYAIGLSLFNLQAAVLIGLIAGLLSIVPYLGFTVGLLTALLASLVQFHDGTHLMYVLLVFIIGNIMEGMILTPWLVGDKIGLHPVAVIFAVLAGGHLFGFLGILLALPVAAVLMVLLRHIKHHYQSSDLYHR